MKAFRGLLFNNKIMNDENEVWKDVVGYEGIYEVSSFGRVKSLERVVNHKRTGTMKIHSKILSNSTDSGGYCIHRLSKNGVMKSFSAHQIVAVAFLGHKPNGHTLVVDHINGDKSDNRLPNLQIMTHRENISKSMTSTTSIYRGVSFDKRIGMWTSRIHHEGKQTLLGWFEEEIDAKLAYLKALENILTEGNI